jgi:hypothetical protein
MQARGEKEEALILSELYTLRCREKGLLCARESDRRRVEKRPRLMAPPLRDSAAQGWESH